MIVRSQASDGVQKQNKEIFRLARTKCTPHASLLKTDELSQNMSVSQEENMMKIQGTAVPNHPSKARNSWAHGCDLS